VRQTEPEPDSKGWSSRFRSAWRCWKTGPAVDALRERVIALEAQAVARERESARREADLLHRVGVAEALAEERRVAVVACHVSMQMLASSAGTGKDVPPSGQSACELVPPTKPSLAVEGRGGVWKRFTTELMGGARRG